MRSKGDPRTPPCADAFALGVLALVGPRAPAVVEALPLGVVDLDDLGAIVVTALLGCLPLRGSTAVGPEAPVPGGSCSP